MLEPGSQNQGPKFMPRPKIKKPNFGAISDPLIKKRLQEYRNEYKHFKGCYKITKRRYHDLIKYVQDQQREDLMETSSADETSIRMTHKKMKIHYS